MHNRLFRKTSKPRFYSHEKNKWVGEDNEIEWQEIHNLFISIDAELWASHYLASRHETSILRPLQDNLSGSLNILESKLKNALVDPSLKHTLQIARKLHATIRTLTSPLATEKTKKQAVNHFERFVTRGELCANTKVAVGMILTGLASTVVALALICPPIALVAGVAALTTSLTMYLYAAVTIVAFPFGAGLYHSHHKKKSIHTCTQESKNVCKNLNTLIRERTKLHQTSPQQKQKNQQLHISDNFFPISLRS